MKIIFSGLTRDRERENGIIDEQNCYAIYFNKAIYRFVYDLENKKSVEKMFSDFKAMKFENCSSEETDGGENISIRFYINETELEAESAVEKFIGDGELERISIDYDFDWLHSVTLDTGENQIFLEIANHEDFVNSETGKKIIEELQKLN